MARILIVEDEAPLRHIVARNLERRGHHVIESASAAEAGNALRTQGSSKCDLILLDVNLPDATGWDVLRQMSDSAGAAPKVIVMTALRPAQSRIAAFQPAAVLLKPFPIEALLRLVDRVLGQAGAESAP
ncbi:MAG TPA: response regulator [Ktedonobacterales bacterium]|jgi:DNA-binding response OmpR family regulator